MPRALPARSTGRPTTYKPEYCEAVIRDAALGYSLSAFAGSIPCCRDTITDWRLANPDFDAACRQAKAVRARFLEGGMMERDIPAPAQRARQFALLNCAPDDWRDKVTVVGGDPALGDKPLQQELTVKFVVPALTQDRGE